MLLLLATHPYHACCLYEVFELPWLELTDMVSIWQRWIWRCISFITNLVSCFIVLRNWEGRKQEKQIIQLFTLLHSFWRIIYRRHFRECHSCCVCSGAACAGNCRPNLEKREYTQLSLAVVGQPRLSLVENCIYNWIKTTLPHLRKTRRQARRGEMRGSVTSHAHYYRWFKYIF